MAQSIREKDQLALRSENVEPMYEKSPGPDGKPRYWYTIKFPVEDAKDGLLLAGISADITETHQQDLQRALLAAIVNDTQDAIYARTLEGLITAWNPAAEQLYGYSAEEMIGSTLDILIPPGMVNDVVQIDNRLKAGERIAQHETWCRAKDGSILHVELTLSLIRDAEGAVSGISTIARDITEHMRLIAERDLLYAELQAEFVRAADIQTHLLPTTVPLMPGYEFAAACRPAREVGGDFFDWTETDDGVRITLGDVTGKGMAAALLMATTRAALRGAANEPIEDVISTVNRALMNDLSHSDSFVTMFHADLRNDGQLRFTDAGHGLALIIRQDGSVDPSTHQQLPIGIMDTPYTAATTRLNHGDVLIVYSDGLPDSRPDLELELAENIATLCASCEDVNEILAILELVSQGNGPRPDDLTLIAVRRKEQPA